MLRKVNKKQGFTLVEITIVVGIITMLVALSIHSILSAKVTANEAAAIRSLRTLQTAFTNYRVVNPRYPKFISDLCGETELPYLDRKWCSQQGSSTEPIALTATTEPTEPTGSTELTESRESIEITESTGPTEPTGSTEAIRQGYNFRIFNVDDDTFQLVATPVSSGITGNRVFVMELDGEITDEEGIGLGSAVGTHGAD